MPKLPVEDIDVLVRSPHAREPSRIYEYIYNRIGKNNGRRTPQHGRARADALVRGGKLPVVAHSRWPLGQQQHSCGEEALAVRTRSGHG